MAVTVVREEEAAPRLRLVPPAPEPAPLIDDAVRIQMVAAIASAAQVLGARFILLLAMVGAISLGALATFHGSVGAIVGAGVYDALVLIPTIGLAWRRG